MLKNLQSNLWTLLTCMTILLCVGSAQAQISEGFETTGTPTNWTFSGAATSTNNPRTGSRALAFAGTGQSATSPSISSPSQLSFYYRRSSNTASWGLKVEVLDATTDAVVATLTAITSVSTTYAQYTADLSSYSNIKVKLTDTRSSGAAERYVDDFTITAGATTYSVTYNGNSSTSGSVPTDSNAYASGATATVLGNAGSLTKTGATFNGWNTAADGSGTTYQAGNTFTVSANTTLYARWATLTPSATTLNGFNYTEGAGPSASQSFNLTGSNLTSGGGTITVTGTTKYDVSSDNSTFGNTATVTYTGTALASTPVYVRLKAGLAAGTHNEETITISGGGTTSSVTANGTVSPNTPYITTSGTLSALSTTYGTASGNTSFTASGSNLTAPIVITVPGGFEISTATGSGFGNSISLSPTSGTVSSTPIYVRLTSTAPVNSYSGNITLTSTGAPTVNVATATSTVSAKALTITGLAGGTKEYDGNTTATVTGTAALNGVVNGDSVTLGGTPVYTFATKAVGTGKAITVTGYNISGTGSGNYTVTQPTGLTGTVTAKSVTVTGATVTTKTYDGTTTATVSGGTVVGAVSGDTVSVSTTGTFASANAGTAIGVTIALTGTDATNYSLTQPGITGTINKASLSITTSAIGITLNGTYTLPGSNIVTSSDGSQSYTVVNSAVASLSGNTLTAIAEGSTTLNINVAEGTNYLAGTASAIINVTTYANGTYETTSAGTWPSGSATWRRLVSGTWTSVSAPSASVTDLLIIKHAITSNASFAATGGVGTKITVANGGRFDIGHSSTVSAISIETGGTVSLNTPSVSMLSTGTITVESGGTLISNSATFNLGDNFWNGTENFKSGSIFEIQNWDWNETSGNERLIDSGATISKNAGDYYFGNIYFNATPSDKSFTFVGLTGTQKLCQNNLTINNGSSTYHAILGSVNCSVEIGGNLIVQQNKLSLGAVSSANITHYLKGNLVQTGGTIDLNQTNSGSASVTMNVAGNFTATAGSIISTDDGCKFVLNANGAQTLNVTTALGARVDFEIASGSETQLTSGLGLTNTTNDFNVLNGGTINVQGNTVSGTGVFNLNSGGTLITGNTGGIPASITATTATYTAGAHYIFNGATTTPFPTATFNSPGNVTTNADVTLNRAITPSGNLTVNSGTLDLGAFTINRANSGGIITLGNGTMLKINGTNGFPSNYATQVINTSTVHFAGEAQPVNKLSANYYNVRLSGTGAKTFDNGTIMDNNLTLESGPTVTLAENNTITVKNQLINNGAETDFVINDNAALLQTNNVSNVGSITVRKISNELYRLDYTMWSSPTNGAQTLLDFSPNTTSTRFYEYKYQNGAESYVHVDALTTTFAPAHSYLIRMPNLDATAPGYNTGTATLTLNNTFIGTPNNGTITRELNTNGNKFTSTGNPYPSPIGINEFFAANSAVIDANSGIYLWRKKNDGGTGSYATVSNASYAFNIDNGNETGGQVNSEYFTGASSTWRIAPGQGFIVKTNSEATGTPMLTFNNGMRKAASLTNGQSFFRTSEESVSRYWINLVNTSNNNASQFTVAYLEDATEGIDYGYDAARLSESNVFSAYTIAENTNLTIQARPGFSNTDIVKAGYVATEAGNFKLKLANTEGVFAQQQPIYIKDNVLGITQEIDAENGYTFATEAGVFNNRFEILYTDQVLGNDTPVINATDVVLYKNNNAITADAGNTIITAIEVYDVQGRAIFSKANLNTTSYTISQLNASHEVLLVKVSTVNGTVNKKIIF